MLFMPARNVAADPVLAKRVLADGHTVAHQTYRHPLRKRMPVNAPGPRSTTASLRTPLFRGIIRY